MLRPCLGMDSMLGLFFVQKVQRLEVFLFPRSGKEEVGLFAACFVHKLILRV